MLCYLEAPGLCTYRPRTRVRIGNSDTRVVKKYPANAVRAPFLVSAYHNPSPSHWIFPGIWVSNQSPQLMGGEESLGQGAQLSSTSELKGILSTYAGECTAPV